MKFGQRLEQTSVPGWSLHNVDYNSLKHQIKVHTTKDQAAATAIAIPGQQDQALKRFEHAFYLELASQHSRVGLFVTSKTDEVSRRLHHLSDSVHLLLLKCTDPRGLSPKRHRKFLRLQRQTEECAHDIKALSRFVAAQVTAFRKILKKYRKWTGSTSLGSRFKDNILDHPKSFTNANFTPVQLQYRKVRAALEAAVPADATPPQQPSPPTSRHQPGHTGSRRSSNSVATVTPATYWNEYEHGSEAGDQDDAYVLYIHPDAGDDFPGLSYMKNMLGAPVDQVRHWLQSQKQKDMGAVSPSETHSLLGSQRSRTDGSSTDYFSIRERPDHEQTTEDEGLSSDGGESYHARRHGLFSSYSYSSEEDSKVSFYHDRVLTRSIVLAFFFAFVLLGVSGVLVLTGRRRLRLEVDAGATLGSVTSLFCACMGLGAMFYRQHPAGCLYIFVVWTAFVTVCALNGVLLVIVAGSSGL
ncbi:hypothetical protein F4777DRAFT_576434 [Nemania sp. FL0916]|nr:hypothetical protein F4777DRAFT_576434 [Nemania sp. FL0916]